MNPGESVMSAVHRLTEDTETWSTPAISRMDLPSSRRICRAASRSTGFTNVCSQEMWRDSRSRLGFTSPHGLAVRTPPFQGGDRGFESRWGYFGASEHRPRQSAVDHHHLAGDVARPRRAEEGRDRGELLDGAHPAGGDLCASELLGGLAGAGELDDAVGVDAAREDAVERDS